MVIDRATSTVLFPAIVVAGPGGGHRVPISTKIWMKTRCIGGAIMPKISSPTKIGMRGIVSNSPRRRPSRRRSESAALR